jgi:endo-alpha-N-acetylgalactosaminidase
MDSFPRRSVSTMKARTWIVIAALSATWAAAQNIVIKSGDLSVALDREFPRVIGYRLPAGELAGNPSATRVVELNGKPAACRITAGKRSEQSAVYQISFPDAELSLDLSVTATPSGIVMETGNLTELAATKLKTLAFPDNPLLSINTTQADAAIATCLATNVDDQFNPTFRERISPLGALKAGDHDVANYLFLSAGSLAGGIASSNFTDTRRAEWKITEAAGVKTFAAGSPILEFRRFDDETPDLPRVNVFITPDANGDGKADWQDAAIIHRRTMPKPFGHELVKTTVGENVAMNFASGAQQPFLKILDEIKRIHLATDGLGNQVIIKGFSSEGHDSANTDCAGNWNERAGGLKDLGVLLEHAGRYNSRIGIHINASEAYPEAKRYQPEILRKDANGNLQKGWSWLDDAHMIDKVQDIRSGQLFSALDQMRRDLPKLDFVYVDTYWENGWPAARTAQKINSLGLPMYSEGDCCIDPWISWGHWRGTNHTIQRFLWFSDRDLFANDAILRSGRADTDGFMGWQNQHNFTHSIRNIFSQRLPGKFLQHFELLRWLPGELAEFSDGVKVSKSGDLVTVTQQGRPLMSWTGDGASPELWVPWPPTKPGKCYLWSDSGGERRLELPPSWASPASVFLYQLTHAGRTGETTVPVIGNRISPKVEKGVAYVIYPEKAKAADPMIWGEGGRVGDPGFDSRGFAAWKQTGTSSIESDSNGNPRLLMASGEASVAQQITGLESGKTYAATVWVMAGGNRSATIEVDCGGKVSSNFVKLCNVRHSAPNDARTGTNYQRLRVVFSASSPTAILTLKGGGSDGAVEFDDVRVVETRISPESAKHYFREDFESVETGGYGPFTCCPGERTHLSESNPPHTRDTIAGRYSLKSRDNGQVLRTLPSSLRLKPATKFRVSCATIGDGRLTAVSAGSSVMTLRFPNKPNLEPSTVTGEFVTRRDTESHLALFRDGGDFIVIDDLVIDELGPASEAEMAATTVAPLIRDEPPPGMKLLLEEKFDKAPGQEWLLKPSKLPGTLIDARDGALSINGYANTTIHADLTNVPAALEAVQVQVTVDGTAGETWGPGLGLVWPGGQQVRINLRGPDGAFGIDSTAAAQAITGKLTGGSAILRLRFDEKTIFAEAMCAADASWQKLAGLPRDKFPGMPSIIRLGKTHAVESLDDHSDIGGIGTTRYTLLKIFGK